MKGQITLQKLEQLKAKHVNWDDEATHIMDSAERDLRRAIATKEVAEMPVIAKILQGIKGEIDEINTLLLQKRDLLYEDRVKLFTKRDVFEMFLDPFGIADRTVEDVEALVDNENE